MTNGCNNCKYNKLQGPDLWNHTCQTCSRTGNWEPEEVRMEVIEMNCLTCGWNDDDGCKDPDYNAFCEYYCALHPIEPYTHWKPNNPPCFGDFSAMAENCSECRDDFICDTFECTTCGVAVECQEVRASEAGETPPVHHILSGEPVDGYEELDRILTAAYAQASAGKGKDRHASKDEPFHEQQITEMAKRLGDQCIHPQTVGPLYQVVKKAYESVRVPKDSAIRELYGVINYAAAAILLLEDEDDPKEEEPFDIGSIVKFRMYPPLKKED